MNSKHEIYYVDSFVIIGPHTLKITFDDASTQIIDFEPLLHGELFGPLRDLVMFNQVRLDPEIRNLVWPNDAGTIEPAITRRRIQQLGQLTVASLRSALNYAKKQFALGLSQGEASL